MCRRLVRCELIPQHAQAGRGEHLHDIGRKDETNNSWQHFSAQSLDAYCSITSAIAAQSGTAALR
jgi:hypothetical protein